VTTFGKIGLPRRYLSKDQVARREESGANINWKGLKAAPQEEMEKHSMARDQVSSGVRNGT